MSHLFHVTHVLPFIISFETFLNPYRSRVLFFSFSSSTPTSLVDTESGLSGLFGETPQSRHRSPVIRLSLSKRSPFTVLVQSQNLLVRLTTLSNYTPSSLHPLVPLLMVSPEYLSAVADLFSLPSPLNHRLPY